MGKSQIEAENRKRGDVKFGGKVWPEYLWARLVDLTSRTAWPGWAVAWWRRCAARTDGMRVTGSQWREQRHKVQFVALPWKHKLVNHLGNRSSHDDRHFLKAGLASWQTTYIVHICFFFFFTSNTWTNKF
jgi:hypothetical protein